jgi:hypothetical protein
MPVSDVRLRKGIRKIFLLRTGQPFRSYNRQQERPQESLRLLFDAQNTLLKRYSKHKLRNSSKDSDHHKHYIITLNHNKIVTFHSAT